jgi:hypothetical protein
LFDSRFVWPSGDYVDRSFANDVIFLARLHIRTRRDSVLRLTVVSLIVWSSHTDVTH